MRAVTQNGERSIHIVRGIVVAHLIVARLATAAECTSTMNYPKPRQQTASHVAGRLALVLRGPRDGSLVTVRLDQNDGEDIRRSLHPRDTMITSIEERDQSGRIIGGQGALLARKLAGDAWVVLAEVRPA